MPLSHGFRISIYSLLSISFISLIVSSCAIMNVEIEQEDEAEIQYNDDITEFPFFNVWSGKKRVFMHFLITIM